MLLLVIPEVVRHRSAPPLTRLQVDANLLARLDLIARDVDGALIDLDVTMANQLTRGFPARGEAKPIHHVIQPTLERGEQVMTRDPRQRGDSLERVVELRL